jgi:hypothetical protein
LRALTHSNHFSVPLRLLSKSERQRTSAEAELRTVSVKLEEVGGRLAETSLRREGLEGTARRLEEELLKEQQRALEARQSHERERNTLNQVGQLSSSWCF